MVLRGRGRHMVFVVAHALPMDHTRQTRACVADTCMRGACDACGGRVEWYAETHILRTVAIPTIARDERQESE